MGEALHILGDALVGVGEAWTGQGRGGRYGHRTRTEWQPILQRVATLLAAQVGARSPATQTVEGWQSDKVRALNPRPCNTQLCAHPPPSVDAA